MDFKFKQFFCKHQFRVVTTVPLKYGAVVNHNSTQGLTKYSHLDSTNHKALPHTIIKTHFFIDDNLVYLCCRKCQKCGLIRPVDVFTYSEHVNKENILKMEGLD
jgi:hypothetical protein